MVTQPGQKGPQSLSPRPGCARSSTSPAPRAHPSALTRGDGYPPPTPVQPTPAPARRSPLPIHQPLLLDDAVRLLPGDPAVEPVLRPVNHCGTETARESHAHLHGGPRPAAAPVGLCSGPGRLHEAGGGLRAVLFYLRTKIPGQRAVFTCT